MIEVNIIQKFSHLNKGDFLILFELKKSWSTNDDFGRYRSFQGRDVSNPKALQLLQGKVLVIYEQGANGKQQLLEPCQSMMI